MGEAADRETALNASPDASNAPARKAPLPTVSVVIATRNRPELLAAALASVSRQTYAGGIETVVVFDQCEPDGSIAREDALRPVRVTTPAAGHSGLAAARNAGARLAAGELLAFLDDDDEWEPQKVRLQVAELARSSRAVCVTGIAIEHDGHRTVRVPVAEDLTVRALVERRVVSAHPSSVVVRKSAFFGAIGPVDEQIPGSYGEDYDWLLRAVRAGAVALVPLPLVRVRWGKSSYFADRWQTIIDANDYLAAKHPEFGTSKVAMARLHGRKAIALAALHRRREARVWAWRALRLSPRDRRAYLALLLSTGALSADTAMRWANRAGRGL